MSSSIDIYCERLDPTFLAEPWNAVSNAGFLVAAFLAYDLAMRAYRVPANIPRDQTILCALMAVIGVGSFLFHTFATSIAQLADVIPIAVYQLTFLALYARRIMRLTRFRVFMLLLGFVVAGQSFSALPHDLLNGSLMYGPAFLFLCAFAVYHRVTRKHEPYILLAAVLLFAVSLIFRSVDMMVCDALPVGVHYMWHLLNAVVLYLTTRAYIQNRPSD